MSGDIQELCQRMGEISLEFAENEEAEKAEKNIHLSEEEPSAIIQKETYTHGF